MWLAADGAGGITLEAAEGDGDDKMKRFKGTAYTGGAMRPAGFYQDIVVDLSGLKVPSQKRPVLLNHDPAQIVGHSDGIGVDGKIAVEGVVSGVGAAAAEVVGSSHNGFPWQMSIGATLHKVVSVDEGEKAEANGRTFAGPILIARKSTLGEVSFVPIGADGKTSGTVAASAAHSQTEVIPMDFENWLKALGFDVAELTDDQKTSLQAKYDAEQEPPAEPDPKPKPVVQAAGGDGAAADDDLVASLKAKALDDFDAELKARREAAEADLTRTNGIRLVCAGGCPEISTDKHPEIEAKALAGKWTRAETELAILKGHRAKAPAAHTPDNSMNCGALEAGMLLASGKHSDDSLVEDYGEKAVEAARKMQPMSLPRLFRDYIRAQGHHPPEGVNNDLIQMAFRCEDNARRSIQASGFTSVTLSGILGNVANKSLLKQFRAYPSKAGTIAGTGSNSDFKEVTRYRMTMTGVMEQVGASGELKHGSFDEESTTARLETYGKIVTLTRQMIINDDLGAFLTIPRGLGRASAIALEKAFWTLWLANTGNFFHSGNHRNVATAVPLDTAPSASLTAANLLFTKQYDLNSDPIGIVPSYLLVPSTLEVVADQLFTDTEFAIMATTTANTPITRVKSNPWRGKFKPVATPWLENSALSGNSTSTWYLVGDPSDVPAAEITHLNNQQTPTVETGDVDFDKLGMSWRVYWDFGVSFQEWRAAVRCAAT